MIEILTGITVLIIPIFLIVTYPVFFLSIVSLLICYILGALILGDY